MQILIQTRCNTRTKKSFILTPFITMFRFINEFELFFLSPNPHQTIGLVAWELNFKRNKQKKIASKWIELYSMHRPTCFQLSFFLFRFVPHMKLCIFILIFGTIKTLIVFSFFEARIFRSYWVNKIVFYYELFFGLFAHFCAPTFK